MKIQRKWLILGAVILGAGALLAAGVPLGTLVLALAVLACPLSMLFGMRMMGGAACHTGPQQAQAPSRTEEAAGRPEVSSERAPVEAGKEPVRT